MKDFLKLLSPLQRKMAAENFIKWLIAAETAASAICLAVVLLSKWVRIDWLWQICAGVWILGGFAAAVTAFYLCKVTPRQTAETADALGGAQGMITTLELLEKSEHSTMESMAVADGLEKARTMEFAKKYSFHFPKRLAMVLGLLLVLVIGAGFAPIAREEKAAVYAQAKLERIEQVKEEMKQEEMTKEEAEIFEKTIKSLEKDLKQAKTEKEAKEAVQEAQQEMKRLEKESVSKDLRSLAEEVKKEKEQEMQALADALENANAQKMQEALEQLAALFSQMTPEQLEKMAELFENAAQEMTDEQMKQALEELQKALEEGLDIEQALESLGKAAIGQMSQNSNLRMGLQKLNRSLGQTGGVLAGNKPNDGTEKGGTGGGTGAGTGDGDGDGTGGSGQGAGGSGEGSGGQGRGRGHAEAEKIYSRTAAGKAGEEVQIQGVDTEGGTTTVTQHKTMGETGESLPYDQVYVQYHEEALNDMKNSQVPYGMQTLVSDYFSLLEK